MLIAEVGKNTKERIHVALVEYHGHRLIDCRTYFQDNQGEWRPTKKGISLSPDTIDEVITALVKGSAVLEDSLSPIPESRKGRPRTVSTMQAPEQHDADIVPDEQRKDTGTVSERVRSFVSSVNGNSQFQSKSILLTLGLTGSKDKHLVNVVLSKLADEGLIERTGTGRGCYRRIV